MRMNIHHIAAISALALLATTGCSGDAADPSAGEAVSSGDEVPTAKLNLLHAEALESGSTVSFYEVSLEPGFILTLEETPEGAPLALDGPTDLSVEETFEYIRPGAELPAALQSANARQKKFRENNPVPDGELVPIEPTATGPVEAAKSRVQKSTTWDDFRSKCAQSLSGYNYGLVECQTQFYSSRVCTWNQQNRRHGARILFERSVDDAYMNIQYRRATHWTLSLEWVSFETGAPSYSRPAMGVTYTWTMPDTHNNYDYYYYAYSYDYGNMFTCAGFKD